MPSYSMNIGEQGVEQNREILDLGFSGMIPHIDTNPPTAHEVSIGGSAPGQLATPLTNAVNPSGDSAKLDIPPSSHDITMRSRNG